MRAQNVLSFILHFIQIVTICFSGRAPLLITHNEQLRLVVLFTKTTIVITGSENPDHFWR